MDKIRSDITQRLREFIPDPHVDVRNADCNAQAVVVSGEVESSNRQELTAGIVQNNPVLRNGDIVNVPRRRAEEAYLLGEIARPDVMDLSIEPITLTRAVTGRGGLQQGRADARGVLVFRRRRALWDGWSQSWTRVFQLDVSEPAGLLLGTRLVLKLGDVVYVLRSRLQRCSDTISRLLPSVQALNVADNVVN